MLATNGYEKDKIVSFKLVNGDEIIAKIIEDNPTQYLVSKPCTAIPSNQGLGLIQTLFTSDLNNNVKLDKQHVMMHAPTIKDVENHYIKTTTGIEPAGAGGIIT